MSHVMKKRKFELDLVITERRYSLWSWWRLCVASFFVGVKSKIISKWGGSEGWSSYRTGIHCSLMDTILLKPTGDTGSGIKLNLCTLVIEQSLWTHQEVLKTWLQLVAIAGNITMLAHRLINEVHAIIINKLIRTSVTRNTDTLVYYWQVIEKRNTPV